jgi:transposase InsO family protein
VSRLCALFGVTRAGYYAWAARAESAHSERDRFVVRAIPKIFEASDGTYGSPRVQRQLVAQGVRVSRRRVERLMRAAGMRGRVARVYRSNPRLHQVYAQHPNRLWESRAKRPDAIWVGDVTYLRVSTHWCYLAVVMDQFSRRVVGWSLKRTRGTTLTRAAFDQAYRRRQPRRLIFHSDRGVEYAAPGFRDRLTTLGVRQSMTRGGSPADNAHAESFFHSLKADVVHGVAFMTDDSLRKCLRRYVRYYNHQRLHSSLGYRSPSEFERLVA